MSSIIRLLFYCFENGTNISTYSIIVSNKTNFLVVLSNLYSNCTNNYFEYPWF